MTYTKREAESILYKLDSIGAVYAREYFYAKYYHNTFTYYG